MQQAPPQHLTANPHPFPSSIGVWTGAPSLHAGIEHFFAEGMSESSVAAVTPPFPSHTDF